MRGMKDKKHLMLDLDETLICSSPMLTSLPKINVLIKHDGRTVMTFPKVVMRPNLIEFLKAVEPHYNLHIFTASEEDYASAILNRLGIRGMFCNLFPRSECKNIHGVHVKDLSDFPFPASDTILIDDMTHQILNQPDQAILIRPFYGDPMDNELMKLVPFLIELSKCSDVRPVGWKLRQFQDNGCIPTKFKKPLFQRVLSERHSVSPKNRSSSPKNGKKSKGKKDNNEKKVINERETDTNKKSFFRSSSVNNQKIRGLKIKPTGVSSPKAANEVKANTKLNEYIVTAPIKMKFALLKQSTKTEQESNDNDNDGEDNSGTEECNLDSDDEIPPSSNPSVTRHLGSSTLKLSFFH